MQVVKLRKKRVLAVAMTFSATFILALMAAVATLQQPDSDRHDRSSDSPNDSVWRYSYEVSKYENETSTSIDDVVIVVNNQPSEVDNIVAKDNLDDTDSYSDSDVQDASILGEYDDGDDNGGDGAAVSDYDGSDAGEDDDIDGEDEDEENENEIFRDGDFDSFDVNTTTTVSETSTSSSKFLELDSRVGDRKLHSRFGIDSDDRRMKRGTAVKLSAFEDRIFWSRQLETLAPKGLSDEQVMKFRERARRLPVTRLTPPTWNRCGRANNQFVTFEDSSHACARHRSPHDYLVQGEVLSFYLARLLGIHNVPAVVLSQVNPDSDQWNSARLRSNGSSSAMLSEAQWEPNTTVALIQWIDGLQRDWMPNTVLNALKTGRPISWKTKLIRHLSVTRLIELLQWSDLVVFDYITGNYDRVASMQDAAEKERRPDIFQQDTIHNLAVLQSRSTSTSMKHHEGIWLIDNESGLLDAYSLMYDNNNNDVDDGSSTSTTSNSQGHRFVVFHDRMLRTFCIFRRSTRDSIKSLINKSTASETLDMLLDRVRENEPLFVKPSVMVGKSGVEFAIKFQKRVRDVYNWMNSCRKRT